MLFNRQNRKMKIETESFTDRFLNDLFMYHQNKSKKKFLIIYPRVYQGYSVLHSKIAFRYLFILHCIHVHNGCVLHIECAGWVEKYNKMLLDVAYSLCIKCNSTRFYDIPSLHQRKWEKLKEWHIKHTYLYHKTTTEMARLWG